MEKNILQQKFTLMTILVKIVLPVRFLPRKKPFFSTFRQKPANPVGDSWL